MGEHRQHRRLWLALAAVTSLSLAVGACSAGVSTGDQAGSPSSTSPGSTVAPATGSTGTTPGTSRTRAEPARAATAPVPSAGCGTSTAGASDKEQHDLTVAGVDRFYLLTTPTAHDGKTPLPLVVDFHGLAEGAQIHAGMTQFSELAKKEGFVVAFPNGTGTPVRWDANTTSNPNHDLEYVDQLLDEIGTSHCIDTSRIYATGLSYGAIMSSFLTCTRANRFAAVAPVAGITIPASGCTPSRPMPVLTFHGTADPILNFNGGVGDSLGGILKGNADESTPPTTAKPADLNGPGYPAAAQAWAVRNGCQPDPTDTKVTDTVIHRVWSCPAGADVEFYIVEGGGHSWPGSEFSKSIGKIVGPTTFDINATDLIWQFFQRFARPPTSA